MPVQPEHILSFKPMGLGLLIKGKEEISQCLLKTQCLFDTNDAAVRGGSRLWGR